MKLLQRDNRLCNASCHTARRPDCSCICGGALHGVGLSAAQEILPTLDLSALGVEVAPVKVGTDKPRRPAKKVMDKETGKVYESFYQCGKVLGYLVDRRDHWAFYALVKAFPGRFLEMNEQEKA